MIGYLTSHIPRKKIIGHFNQIRAFLAKIKHYQGGREPRKALEDATIGKLTMARLTLTRRDEEMADQN
jgi:hypothetical protein